VSAALKRTGYIPVTGTINGAAFRAGLVSLGRGRHRLNINGEMRRAADVDDGDRITVVLKYDPRPRRLPIPKALSRAFKAHPAARKAWAGLTPSRRKEVLSYLNNLKTPESLKRNVERVIEQLLWPRAHIPTWRK
jgi:hypothetical protein